MTVADIKGILVQWDAGDDLSRIARTLGYTRPTVRKYVRAAEQVGLRPGSRRRGEVEWERLARAALSAAATPPALSAARAEVAQHHAYLDQWVGEVRLTVLHQRLRDGQGLHASWGTFYRYVRSQWPERLQRSSHVTIRLDDPPPGAEGQVDFFYVSRWYDPEAGRERRLSAFLMTLSQSRHTFLYPVLSEGADAWLAGHVAAFHFFGGAPRRLVPDNLTAGIIKADRYDPRLNRAYGELTRYYGCVVDPARVAQPTDKPKVERTVSYARESFFRGQSFPNLGVMRAAARQWCLDIAGVRLHGTTGEQPLASFQEREQAALIPLPPQPWEPVTWWTAKVHADCHLQAGGARYSVPYTYVGQTLDVRLGRHTTEVYAGATLVTTHPRQTTGRATRIEHYPAAGQAFLRNTPPACLRQAQALGEATATLVAALLATETTHHLRETQAILRLADQYGGVRLDRACALALAAGDGRLRTVRGLLDREVTALDPEPQPTAARMGAYLRGPAAFAPVLVEVGR
jgi:transposase